MKRAREMLDLPLMMVDPEQRADWLKLSFEEVTDILRENKLLTDSEDTVFTALSHWVEANDPSLDETRELLNLVRLTCLSHAFFHSVLVETKWVQQNTNLLQSLFRLLAYQTTPIYLPRNNTFPEAWTANQQRPRSRIATTYSLQGKTIHTFWYQQIRSGNLKVIYDVAIERLEHENTNQVNILLAKRYFAHGIAYKIEYGFRKDELLFMFTPSLQITAHGQVMGASIHAAVQITVVTNDKGTAVYQGFAGLNKRCIQAIPIHGFFEKEQNMTIKFETWNGQAA